MKLYLIRHTKVDVPAGICYGQLDVNVTNTYEDEKGIILNNLKEISLDKIYSSPLKRCKLLANALANNNRVVEYDERLKEVNFGNWEGLKWEDIEKTKEAKLWFSDYINTPCPNGESYSDVLNRVRLFINDLSSNKQLNRVAIVCHAGVIRAFYSIIEGITPYDSLNITINYGDINKLTLI